MIEFKRVGDVMVFECPGFKIKVSGNGAERISVNPGRHISGSGEMMALLTDAFQILDMMTEHKAKHDSDKNVTEMNFKINVDTEDAADVISKLNEYAWKHAPSENPPGHQFREFMKREGL